MLRDLLKPEILELIDARDWSALRDSLGDWPAPEALVDTFRERGFTGATVLRASAGFGAPAVIHTER